MKWPAFSFEILVFELHNRFQSRLSSIEQKARDLWAERSTLPEWQMRGLTEALISDSWQAWCGFCRGLLIRSCQGCTTRGGVGIAPRGSDNDVMRIGYEAAQAAKSRPITPSGRNSFLRQEPTWGDQTKLLSIILGLNPNNSAALLGVFGIGLSAPAHLQSVRNACAHKNVETSRQVKLLSPFYSSSMTQAPAMFVWGTNTRANTFILYSWFDELQAVAALATQ